MNVSWHDGHALCVNSAQVGILHNADQKVLTRNLQRLQRIDAPSSPSHHTHHTYEEHKMKQETVSNTIRQYPRPLSHNQHKLIDTRAVMERKKIKAKINSPQSIMKISRHLLHQARKRQPPNQQICRPLVFPDFHDSSCARPKSMRFMRRRPCTR